MAKERFESREFKGSFKVACKYDDGTTRYWQGDKATAAAQIISIVKRYQEMGYNLSLRQLHYQMVSRNWIVNHTTAYKKLGNILDDLRYSGQIDWDAIVDRGRQPFMEYWVKDIPHALRDTIYQYKLDRMKGQDSIIEVWTEKDALSEILRRSTARFHVRLIVNKGYTSSSAAYTAYQRWVKAYKAGQKFVVLYIGDHDPSGLDMIRDIRERLSHFIGNGNLAERILDSAAFKEWYEEEFSDDNRDFLMSLNDKLGDKYKKLWSEDIDSDKGYELAKEFDGLKIQAFIKAKGLLEVKPICLTYDQVKQYDLPENPTKMTDTRADGYIRKYGRKCWEVDALEPQVLTEIVESNIINLIDVDLYNDMLTQENHDKGELSKVIDQFNKGDFDEDEDDEE